MKMLQPVSSSKLSLPQTLAKSIMAARPMSTATLKNFFARTYLTDGLSDLLDGAARRLNNDGGDPVVELQTNFGGGKTHSMLALYHMAGSTDTQDLPGIDSLFREKKTCRS